MAMSNGTWKDRIPDLVWGMLSGPGSTTIYIAAAMLIAALASSETGIPAYIIVAVAVVLVLFLDPPEKSEGSENSDAEPMQRIAGPARIAGAASQWVPEGSPINPFSAAPLWGFAMPGPAPCMTY